MRARFLTMAAPLSLAACTGTVAQQAVQSQTPPEARADPAAWPQSASPAELTDARTEAAITALIAQMSLEQKVGQTIQADIGSITPADLQTYPLGSILAGGNSGPNGNERSPAQDWERLVGEFRANSPKTAQGGVTIPILFGVDAVHGHNNIPGATLFPHNVGLGAARDPELIRRIGRITAAEIAASGIEWTFAPTLAVPQDLRWGRTYEGYSSDPSLVAGYSAAMVLGLQGPLAAGEPLGPDEVAATAKHFLADGGTIRGKDQGDARLPEAELVATHALGYPPAIEAGALTVMASFSSWNGVKHHGNRSLLTDVLKDRMGFDGLVVGDWNGHGQVAGCSNTDCPQALLAGLDLYMAPDSWKGLYESTLASAQRGDIPLARIEDAVRRILRVKFKLGLMGDTPVRRGAPGVIGSPAHLAVAREAVAKSLVLLKNNGSILPIKPGARLLVAGAGADSMAMQSGGWTVSWQGTDVTKADFPNGQTIWEGLRDAVAAAGGRATLSSDGAFTAKPDAAIVVFGEEPYAEFEGDIANLDYAGPELALIEKLKDQGIPVVTVFLSGRPMFTNPELAASDAFVAAWLPGSQGAGIADVLVARRDGTAVRDFTGKLSFAWPAGCEGEPDALFPLGFGGSYASNPVTPDLSAECVLSGTEEFAVFERGLPAGVAALADGTALPNLIGGTGNLTVSGFDVAAQEDARRFTWTGPATLRLGWPARSLPATGAFEIRYQVANAPAAPVTLTAGGGTAVDLTSSLALAAGKGWRVMQVPVACLGNSDIDGISIAAGGAFAIDMDSIRFVREAADENCTGPF